MLARLLDSGKAYEQLERMVRLQGGRLNEVPALGTISEQVSESSGYFRAVQGQRLGYAVIALGGGRKFVGQAIDPTVGLEMLVRIGDKVERGQPLVRIFSSSNSDRDATTAWLQGAFEVGDTPPMPVPLFQTL